MNLEHSNAALFAALAQAQAEVENATKGNVNPHFKSRYADLAEVLNTVRPTFAKHGLALSQSTEFDGALVSVTTAIMHKEGGYITSVASCTPAKTDGQGVGAATTYLRRYSLASMAGIAQEDDDGQSAAHDRKPAPPAAPSRELSLLLDGVEVATDIDALRNLHEQAKALPSHEREMANAAIRNKKSKLEK